MKIKPKFKVIILFTIISFSIYTIIDVIKYVNNPVNSAPWEICLFMDLLYLLMILSIEIIVYKIITQKIFYLAYGSNISLDLIKEHCKSVILIGVGKLKNYKLNFKTMDNTRSFATIDKEKGNYLPVVLYKISKSDLKTLDLYEEVEDKLYYKKRVLLSINNRIYFPIVYIMNKGSKEQKPQKEYLEKLYKGYKEYGLNTKYIDESIQKINKETS